jgi:hypothetical protein
MRISRRKAVVAGVAAMITVALLLVAGARLWDRHKQDQLARCEAMFRVLFPEGTEIVAFKDVAGFMAPDVSYRLVVRFPRNRLDSFILPSDEPMSTEDRYLKNFHGPKENAAWWHPDSARSFKSQSYEFEYATTTTVLIDLDDPETVTAYLLYSEP